METAAVRQRVREAIDSAKRRAAERRARNADAMKAWDAALGRIVPLAHQLAQALKAEGHAFRVLTPGASVRLDSERNAADYVELALDTSGERPAVVATVSRARGRSVVVEDQHVRDATVLDDLRDEDVLDALVSVMAPLIER